MKIKEHSRTWPPRNGRARTGGGDIVAVVDLDDVVLTAQKFAACTHTLESQAGD
jgi:hypothetical protein